MIAILANPSERQLELVGEMADEISPRPGRTPRRLTIGAAEAMNSLAQRATRFRHGRNLGHLAETGTEVAS